MAEPQIIINGHVLTEGQAMTVRVAIGAFANELREHGLGHDEHGQRMMAAYQARLREIAVMLYEERDDAQRL